MGVQPAFIAAPSVLLWAVPFSPQGPRNREIKLWCPQGGSGSAGAGQPWQCIQTVSLLVGAEAEGAGAGEKGPVALWEKVGAHKMFCHVHILHSLGLVVLADTPRQAIYVLHLEFGAAPGHTKVASIAQFLVTMPILSFTASLAPAAADADDEGAYQPFENGPDSSDSSSSSDTKPGRVHIYCMQTASIQQYSLELDVCLPPPSASAPTPAPSPAPAVAAPPAHPETSTASSPAVAHPGLTGGPALDSATVTQGTGKAEPSGRSASDADSTAGAVAPVEASAQPDSAVESAAPGAREGEAAAAAEGSGDVLRDVEDRTEEPRGTPPPQAAASKPRLLTPQDLLSMSSAPEEEAPSRTAGAPEAAAASSASSSPAPASAPPPAEATGSGSSAAAASIFPSILSPQALLGSFMAQGKGAAAAPTPAPAPAPELAKAKAAPTPAKGGGAPDAPAVGGPSVGGAATKLPGKASADAGSEPSVAAPVGGPGSGAPEASGSAAAAPAAAPPEGAPKEPAAASGSSFPPIPFFTKGAASAPAAGESSTQGTPSKGKKHRGPKEAPPATAGAPSDVSQGAPAAAPAPAAPAGEASAGLSRSGSSSSVAQEQPRAAAGAAAGAAGGVPPAPALGSSASSTSLLVHDADSASATQSLSTLAAPPPSPGTGDSTPAALVTLSRDVVALQQAVQQVCPTVAHPSDKHHTAPRAPLKSSLRGLLA